MKNNGDFILDMFVEMCSQITYDGDEFYFPAIEYMDKFNSITSNENYSLLSNKMDKLLIIINNNPRLIDLDLETELWQML